VPQAAEGSSERERMPRLVPGWEEKTADLSPEEGFLLSRIDGQTSWGALRAIAGLPPDQVDLCLKRWIDEGLVKLDRGRPGPPATRLPARTLIPGASGSAGTVDPSLDLPVELQERIVAFEAQLDRPYHEILGVPRDAAPRAIKRAYFKLSKDFHPDRYYRQEIGDFAQRLDRVFKKVALAYELLMDPATRAELERCPEAPAAAPEATLEEVRAQPRTFTKREWLARMRRQFRIPEELLAERRLRARQLAEAARVSQHRQSWNEAASSIRLAIAFDPWCNDYKDAFGEIQAQVNQLRAAKLLEEAGDAWDARATTEALHLYEEVLHYRPADAEAHDKAAQVALELEAFEPAREYAERACELTPEAVGYQLTLGRVLRRMGLRDRACEVFETARKLDPQDSRVQDELVKLRQRSGRSSGGKR
jgi:tetratricopeptide (TPR) repeat protein